jgi:hypothetical protein
MIKWRILPKDTRKEGKKKVLDHIAQRVADSTGMLWDETSWIRPSPGHENGDSLDIAPRFLSQQVADKYARAKMSDPVLFKREALLRRLMALAIGRDPVLERHHVLAVIAVENDHLHIQLGVPTDPRDVGIVIPMPFGRDLSNRYSDSSSRIQQHMKPHE